MIDYKLIFSQPDAAALVIAIKEAIKLLEAGKLTLHEIQEPNSAFRFSQGTDINFYMEWISLSIDLRKHPRLEEQDYSVNFFFYGDDGNRISTGISQLTLKDTIQCLKECLQNSNVDTLHRPHALEDQAKHSTDNPSLVHSP